MYTSLNRIILSSRLKACIICIIHRRDCAFCLVISDGFYGRMLGLHTTESVRLGWIICICR